MACAPTCGNGCEKRIRAKIARDLRATAATMLLDREGWESDGIEIAANIVAGTCRHSNTVFLHDLQVTVCEDCTREVPE